jgi:hypothetical protein
VRNWLDRGHDLYRVNFDNAGEKIEVGAGVLIWGCVLD